MTEQGGSEKSTGEGFRQKVLLALLDKGVLALVAAAVGFLFSQQLDRTQAILDYQKKMFEDRRIVYEQILLKAQAARDKVLSAYPADAGAQPYESTGGDWQRRLGLVQAEIEKHHNRRTGWSGGAGSSSWWSIADSAAAVRSLRDLDAFRKSNALLLSRVVDNAIDVFLEQLSKDLELLVVRQQAQDEASPALDAERGPLAAEAYKNLLGAMRESLKIEEMVAG